MFCRMCGKQIPDDSTYCNGCGSRSAPDFQARPNPVPGTSTDDSVRVISALGYLGILFFLPLVVHPNSSYARFHANQGLVLLIAEVVGGIASGVLSGILFGLSWITVTGWMFALMGGMLSAAVGIFGLVLTIMGIVNAATGKMHPLPLIGHITLIR